LILTVLLAAAGGAWAVRGMLKDDAVDSVTLCPANGAGGSLVFLFDLTDPLGTTQSMALRAFVEDRIARSPRGTLVALGMVSDDASEWGARNPVCKPMTGAEAGDLVRNSAQAERRYQEAFVEPLQDVFAAMLAAGEAARSPIMESLQALMVGTADIAFAPGATREIVIVSDLLQHSDAMSFYRGETWTQFRASPAYDRPARNLEGVDVTILRVPRAEARIDPGAVDDFWVRYFEAQGATRIRPRTLGDL
jgi:hypothetical protein